MMHGALDARSDANDEAAVVLEFVLFTEDLRLGRAYLGQISLKPREQRLTDGPLLRAGGQQIDYLLQLREVIDQQVAARQLQSVARDLRCDIWVAVAVAAYPGAKAQHLRQLMRLNVNIVCGAQRVGDFAIEYGQRFENRDIVVVEPHLDFVVNRGPARADFVGLPERGDFGQHKFF